MLKRFRWIGAILLGAALVIGCAPGCTTMQGYIQGALPTKPESVGQTSVYIQKLADAAEMTSTELLNAKKINSSASEKVYEHAAEVRRYGQLARDAEKAGDAVSARNWLDAASISRKALEDFMRANSVSLPTVRPEEVKQ